MHRTIRRTAAAVLLTFTLTACDGIAGVEIRFADNARVSVAGESPVPLLLITSVNFVATRDFLTGELVTTLINADTVVITTLPYERSLSLRGRDRFLARVANPDVNETATVHLQVELDGQLVFTQWASMRDASLEYTSSFGG